MNERIKELAEQAKNFMTDQVLYQSRVYNRTLSVDESADIFEEKFAELIIRECRDIAYEYDEPKLSGPGMIIGNRIEEHFGVEE